MTNAPLSRPTPTTCSARQPEPIDGGGASAPPESSLTANTIRHQRDSARFVAACGVDDDEAGLIGRLDRSEAELRAQVDRRQPDAAQVDQADDVGRRARQP
jgi:hypothetical protein